VIPIDGLVVCENYSDYFCQCVENWKKGLRSVTVVTSFRDVETFNLARSSGLELFMTDIFWDNGAKFNKGAAIAGAYSSREWSDWVLFFDADINPPANWMEQICAKPGHPEIGNLYGAHRVLENGKKITEGEIVGAFMLFHSSDQNAQVRPIVDTHWSHCGNYDSTFQDRWPKEKRIKFGMKVQHIGHPFQNWCGRGNAEGMQDLWDQRAENKGWKHERIDES